MKHFVTIGVFLMSFSLFSQTNEEVRNAIEEKYGEQWEFCKCVVKLDSINTVLMNESLTVEEFNVILERSDYIDMKCKVLLVMYDSKTPESRAALEQRVKNCLQEED